MPPLPSPGQVLRTSLEVVDSLGRLAVTRFFTSYTGTPPTNTEMNTFCTAVGTAWGTDIKSLVQETSELYVVQSIDLSIASGSDGTASPAIAGTLAGGILPFDTALVASYEVQRHYRGGHPRGYWPFGDDTKLLNAQNWTTAFQGLALTGIENFFSAVAGLGWSGAGALAQVNVSYHTGFTVAISPTTGRARNVPKNRAVPVVDPVLSYIARQGLGSQRRRLGKGA